MSFRQLLPVAIAENDIETVKALIAADVNLAGPIPQENGSFTALGLAAFYGHTDIARLLLDSGVNPNQRCTLNGFQLHECYFFDLNLESNGLPEWNPVLMSPLLLAASNGHLETVQYLQDHEKTNCSLADNYGCNVLFHALRCENRRLFSYLCRSYTNKELVESVDMCNRSLLSHASYFDTMESFTFLLSISDDVSQVDMRGRNALHWSVYNDNPEMIRQLIKKGCDTSQMDINRRTPLSLAAVLGKPNAVKLLYPVSDYKTKDDDGNYLLHMSVLSGNIQTVRILLDSGVNINKYNDQGATAAILAVRDGRNEIVDLFIERGCDLNLPLPPYQRPLDFAVIIDDTDMVEKLVKGGSDIDYKNALDQTPLMTAISERKTESALKLIELGADLECRDMCDYRPLHLAVLSNDLCVMRAILARHGFVDASTSRGVNPLSLAVSTGHSDAVVLLLRHDADIDTAGLNRKSPLRLALEYKHIHIFHMLMNAGALTCAPYLPAKNRRNLEMSQAISEVLPLNLMQQCRCFIRRSLRPNTRRSILQLPLPKPLLEYLLLEEGYI